MTRFVHQQKYPETRPLRLSEGDTVLVRSLSTHRGLKAGHEAWITASAEDLDALVQARQIELVGESDSPKAKAAPRKKASPRKSPAKKKAAAKKAPAKKAAKKAAADAGQAAEAS